MEKINIPEQYERNSNDIFSIYKLSLHLTKVLPLNLKKINFSNDKFDEILIKKNDIVIF